MRLGWMVALGAGFTAAVAAIPAAGSGRALAMLNGLHDGKWELRLRDGGGVQRLCISDHRRLIQLRHPGVPCDYLILEDKPGSVTVQYTCPGKGFGRTSIRRESAELLQLEAQGVANGLPFDFSAEGRWVGECRS